VVGACQVGVGACGLGGHDSLGGGAGAGAGGAGAGAGLKLKPSGAWALGGPTQHRHSRSQATRGPDGPRI
jgi:hypothetical protein